MMEKPNDEPIEYWDFAWRSLVFPGWGHFYLDQPIIGSAYMATSLVLLTRTYETRRVALKAQSENNRQADFNFLLNSYGGVAHLETMSDGRQQTITSIGLRYVF
jgi:hypothetical protein